MPTDNRQLATDNCVLILELDTEDHTLALGRALANCLPDPAVVALNGLLGAGKTRLVQGLASGLDIPVEAVTSPTFVLIQEHAGRRPLFHLDAYRLNSAEELWQLGIDEYFEAPGITAIEWADRVVLALPPERLEIVLETVSPAARRATIRAAGNRYQATLAALRLQFLPKTV